VETYHRASRAAGIVALLALVALTVLSVWSVLPPAARGDDTPPTEFSAARAFRHVERIGGEVHVAGSPAADSVREYLVDTLTELGLRTEVQDAIGGSDALGDSYGMARVRNVVALLPGRESSGRVIMVAHYDSVQVSYGGNDDGAGVSTLLETARALTAGAQPRNDIVFVFTDAEEACLCGAEAFVSQHRWAADGGVVLNFESRGSTGPAIMFETSQGNAGVVDVYGDAVPNPVGTSFAVEVYRILPNDTDFTPFREQPRFVGLNAAYIDGSAVYHTPQDTPATMDRDSLQHHGGNALALARAFGDADLAVVGRASAGDATYFPLTGLLVRYPGWLVWPLAAAALLGALALAVLARVRRATSVGRLLAGFGLGLIPLLAAPILAQVLWFVLTLVRPGYREMIDPWQPGWFRDCVLALVAVTVLVWYGLLRRRIGPWALFVGAFGWLALLGVVLAAVTPGGSYLAALPALAGAIAGMVALLVRSAVGGLVAFALAGAVAVVILAPTVLLFFPALGLATGGAAAFFAVLLGLALLPLLDYLYGTRRSWLPGAVAGGLVVATLAVGLAVDRFDADHPVPTQLMYALDTDTGQARWVSAETEPGEWTSQYVSGREDLAEAFPILGNDLATGTAQVANLPAPMVEVLADSTTDGRRTLSLVVRPQRSVRLVYLEVDGVVERANVAGRPVGEAALGDESFGILFHAPPPEGLRVIVELAGSGPVRVRAMDGSDGLTSLPGFRPRPEGVGIEGSHDSELVLVARTYTV